MQMYKFVNYKMKEKEVIHYIKNWILKYSKNSGSSGFVIGISGGIDSALTSTLSALSGKKTLCIEMPIHQNQDQINRGRKHINWLKEKYKNVQSVELDLSNVFDRFISNLPAKHSNQNELCLVNVRARLRMTTLYYYAQLNNYLVLGTGNKVEDFGVGFFTKYGDGGVDLSPIADLLKTEVYCLSRYLKIDSEILEAKPTDGLWGDDKTDEDQLGATYPELEWAMSFNGDLKSISEREKEVLTIYETLNRKNQHKMNEIPVCKIPKSLK
tara:strand:- start:9950 stop:10756 length:807 start_codon:yes stop_codon:yes gene_type:complete